MQNQLANLFFDPEGIDEDTFALSVFLSVNRVISAFTCGDSLEKSGPGFLRVPLRGVEGSRRSSKTSSISILVQS